MGYALRNGVLLVFCVTLVVGGVVANLGVDVSSPVSQSSWTCILSAGFNKAIVRAWTATGSSDTNAPATIQAAKAAGITEIDVYMFPCAGKGAAEQVNSMIEFLKSKDAASYQNIWIDVESNPNEGCGWPSNTASNCEYIGQLIKAVGTSAQVGIYTTQSQWTQIAGSQCTVASKQQLWYADFDNNPSFYDYEPFGGWTTPTMKQYNSEVTVCGVLVDQDYFGGPSTSSSTSSPSSSSPASSSSGKTTKTTKTTQTTKTTKTTESTETGTTYYYTTDKSSQSTTYSSTDPSSTYPYTSTYSSRGSSSYSSSQSQSTYSSSRYSSSRSTYSSSRSTYSSSNPATTYSSTYSSQSSASTEPYSSSYSSQTSQTDSSGGNSGYSGSGYYSGGYSSGGGGQQKPIEANKKQTQKHQAQKPAINQKK